MSNIFVHTLLAKYQTKTYNRLDYVKKHVFVFYNCDVKNLIKTTNEKKKKIVFNNYEKKKPQANVEPGPPASEARVLISTPQLPWLQLEKFHKIAHLC